MHCFHPYFPAINFVICFNKIFNMSLTIKGVFENGKIVLDELPPCNKKMPVKIIFPDIKNDSQLKKNEIRFGSLKGKISVPDNFDDEIDVLNDYM